MSSELCVVAEEVIIVIHMLLNYDVMGIAMGVIWEGL